MYHVKCKLKCIPALLPIIKIYFRWTW